MRVVTLSIVCSAIAAISVGYAYLQAGNKDCSQTFVSMDVVNALSGARITPRRKGEEIIGYSIYHVQDAPQLSASGLSNADLLVAVCGVSSVEVFKNPRSVEEFSCCIKPSEKPELVFKRYKGSGYVRVPMFDQ